jgi:hypothetical protein
MKKIIFLLLITAGALRTQTTLQHTWIFNPAGGTAVAPDGKPSATVFVKPSCCPATALEVTGNALEDKAQWIIIPLNMESAVLQKLSYSVNTSGRTHILQTRLLDMSWAGESKVIFDQTGSEPGPFDLPDLKPQGALSLAIRLGIPGGDKLWIGPIRLTGYTTHKNLQP